MYECLDCGAEFETPVKEHDTDGGEHAEEIDTCPDCGSDDIMDIVDIGEDDYDENIDPFNGRYEFDKESPEDRGILHG